MTNSINSDSIVTTGAGAEQPYKAVHGYPRPWTRRVATRLTTLILILAGLGTLAQIVVFIMLWPRGILLVGTLVFTVILLAVPLMRTALHPGISIHGDELTLQPMLWRAQTVSASALVRLLPHPLIRNNEIFGRLLHGRNYRPREGCVIAVDPSTGLHWSYRLVGIISGAGYSPAFAISSTTHAAYPELRTWIDAHIPRSKTD